MNESKNVRKNVSMMLTGMVIGAGFTGKNMAERMVEVFLTTEFEGGRHERRVNKMMALEQE